MKKTLLEMYALLICLGTIACFAISFGIGVYSTIGILDPEITLSSWEYNPHQTNDDYWEDKQNSNYSPLEEKKENAIVRPSEDELTEQRLESYALALKTETRENKQSILQISIILFICTALFFVHWRIAKSART
jgi:hypothetical protein